MCEYWESYLTALVRQKTEEIVDGVYDRCKSQIWNSTRCLGKNYREFPTTPRKVMNERA